MKMIIWPIGMGVTTLSQMCHFWMTMGMYTTITPPITYSYVDLGLPSGTKWAAQNVGARKPSDAGLYFQWGDTVGYTADQVGNGEEQKKFASDWSDYKWFSDDKLTKYTTTGATLELEDDAAHVNMGGSWHMPTPTQISELINTANTTNTWATQDGVNGRLFTSKSDPSKSIFFPAEGDAKDDEVNYSGSNGSVWSSMLAEQTPTSGNYEGQLLSFDKYPYTSLSNYYRFVGLSVRGVIG